MVVRRESTSGAPVVPALFHDVVDALALARLRPEVLCEAMPAPQRIAPHATALSADVTLADVDVATGRLIVLHDPAGNDAWNGTFRCVSYVRAEIELDMAADPMLGQVAWSWLLDALEGDADATALSGTVTRVATESFGSMAEDEGTAQIEIRASWTPTVAAGADIVPHVEAWGELLCTAAGLEPVPEGVAVMPSRRGQRGATR
ncbi:DUF3000 domain-containing protein [Nocardioides sp.]|uniref:DUF3000 domain-containing protein n=1 Tax=Nocardioides sp. TaxID=35761 RepID=UPI00351599FB